MSYGYSQRLVTLNKKADKKLLGVILGKACIEAESSVRAIADHLGVSRTTVYNWFTGLCDPHPKHHAAISKLLKRLK
jgi:DNA invertase Pin-like site-specific DNA recombinase